MTMLVIGLIACVFVIIQSCKVPKSNLTRFAKGSLKKLTVLDPAPKQPNLIFKNAHNENVGLADFHGQTVLLNIWASWCAPCIAELPSLERLQKERGSNKFTVIAVSMDRTQEDAQKFYQRAHIKHLDLYHDPSFSLSSKIGVSSLPISVLYDPKGGEIARIAGEVDWQSDAVIALLDHVIADY